MIRFADLFGQYLSIRGEIDDAMRQVIASAAFVGGESVRCFERDFAEYTGAAHCIGVANGTDAIEIILEAFQFPAEAEVIVPANSFIASSEPVTRSGCRVVFCDVDDRTYTLEVRDVERRITARTAAIVAVHLYGHPAPMDELQALARPHGIRIIEDCAQAHGAQYHGRRPGSIGDAGAFSFYPGKNLGAYGDAGAITTGDKALATRCRMIGNHGRVDKYNHECEGRNSRLDGLQAAVLGVKLRHLDAWVAARNRVAAQYSAGLSGVGDLVLPTVAAGCRHAFHLYVVRTARRDALADFLHARAIQTGIHYPIALPKLPAYRYLGQPDEAMFACKADRTLLSLPVGEHLGVAEVGQVIDAIKEFYRAGGADD